MSLRDFAETNAASAIAIALAVTISRPFDFFKVVGGHWKVILGHDRSDGSLTEPATFSFGQAGPRFQNR